MGGELIDLLLHAARLDLMERIGPWPTAESIAYTRTAGIDTTQIAPFVGAFGVVRITDHGHGLFEFDEHGVPGFVFETYGIDGESVVDLVGWTLDRPDTPLSMFGRVGLLNLWDAFGTGTYVMEGALVVHATHLAWLQSGCSGGSAIVAEGIAARQLLDLPGRIVAANHHHARKLRALAKSVVRDDLVLLPRNAA